MEKTIKTILLAIFPLLTGLVYSQCPNAEYQEYIDCQKWKDKNTDSLVSYRVRVGSAIVENKALFIGKFESELDSIFGVADHTSGYKGDSCSVRNKYFVLMQDCPDFEFFSQFLPVLVLIFCDQKLVDIDVVRH